MELLVQTYPHYVEPGDKIVANFIEFVLYAGLAVGTFATGYLVLAGVMAAVKYFRGKKN